MHMPALQCGFFSLSEKSVRAAQRPQFAFNVLTRNCRDMQATLKFRACRHWAEQSVSCVGAEFVANL